MKKKSFLATSEGVFLVFTITILSFLCPPVLEIWIKI